MAISHCATKKDAVSCDASSCCFWHLDGACRSAIGNLECTEPFKCKYHSECSFMSSDSGGPAFCRAAQEHSAGEWILSCRRCLTHSSTIQDSTIGTLRDQCKDKYGVVYSVDGKCDVCNQTDAPLYWSIFLIAVLLGAYVAYAVYRRTTSQRRVSGI